MITGFSYFGVYNPEYAKLDFARMKDTGANAVLITLAEEDVEFYLDTKKELVHLAHESELLVYMNPWAVGRVFGGESYSGFLVRHPKEMQIDSSGEPVPAACMNRFKFREFMTKWVDAAEYCGADIAMWDEPHFFIFSWDPEFAHIKDRFCCCCDLCKKLYKECYDEKMPNEETEQVRLFRQESIIRFLADFSTLVSEKQMKNSVCILPPTLSYDDGIEDVQRVFQIPTIDIVGTDPYWGREHNAAWVEEHYRHNAKNLVELGKKFNKEPEMWIKNFSVSEGQEDFVVLATDICAQEGVRRILAWSYLGSAYMTSLRSKNPQQVYQKQSNAFRKWQAVLG